MSVTPFQIFEHAKSLSQDSEAEIRAKISRLYYALFSHACDFNSQLPSEGNLLKKDAGNHHQLAQKLTNPTVSDANLQAKSRDLGTKQKLAHELRVKADYELGSTVDKNDLVRCLGYVTRGMEISPTPPNVKGQASSATGRPTLTPTR
jgi:hypothetical protein